MAAVVSVTESELLEAVRAAAIPAEPPPGAMTVRELQTALGLSRSKIQQALAALRLDGRLTKHVVRRQDATGRFQLVAAYTIGPPKAKPKR